RPSNYFGLALRQRTPPWEHLNMISLMRAWARVSVGRASVACDGALPRLVRPSSWVAPHSSRCRCAWAVCVVLCTSSTMVAAQTSTVLDPVVVTATRVDERAFDLPVAIDS